MSVVRWSRAQALGCIDPLALDELDEVDVVVVDDVTGADDDEMAWCRSAPCVVVAVGDGSAPSCTAVDVVLRRDEVDALDAIAAQAMRNPSATRALVDVLRVVERLDVTAGLVVESLAYSALLTGPEFGSWLRSQPVRVVRTFSRPPVRLDRVDDELVITLDRVENRNAFSAEMRDRLFESISVAEIDTTIGRIVIEGEGPVFGSGGDLTEFGSTSDVMRAHQIRTLRSVGGALARSSATTEVRMRGACVGAGVELSAFADHVVADRGTTVRLPEVAMGLIPGAGGTVSLTRRIGRQRTAQLALLGDAVEVDDPLVHGLVDVIR